MNVALNQPGKRVLMMGNEAIARGAIEAGLDFSASYPGSPSSEIQTTLVDTARARGHFAQWSVNEKVALESCVGASFGGMRAITSMKQNGLNVAADILMTINLSGTKGGIVLVVCDDPQGHSSTNEMDSRNYARFADLPMLEPSSAQEAKDMTRWAFELSERLKCIVIIRSVTRISHARGDVTLGEIEPRGRKPYFGEHDRYLSLPPISQHRKMHERMEQARALFEKSPFNEYIGPEHPQHAIVASGAAVMYAREAVQKMGLDNQVGIMKLGATWPLPEEKIERSIGVAKEWLVMEEIDPFMEQNLKSLIIDRRLGVRRVYGKSSGHVAGRFGPAVGEMNPDIAAQAISKAWGYKILDRRPIQLDDEARKLAFDKMPYRDLAFCPGCPHRASFWVANQAIKMDGRDGVVMGDIGCYTLGAGRTGYYLLRTMQCMGSGIGFANGLAQLEGFNRPVLAFAGDSTFFHSCIPGLINAKYNDADLTLIVLDNSATSMTGFQPHPGTGKNTFGEDVEPIDIADICRGVGVPTFIMDPFDMEDCAFEMADLMREKGLKVIIFRHPCALLEAKRVKKSDLPEVVIDAELCAGDSCGCNRFCSRVFGCPALVWNGEDGHAQIDEALCSRCGVCVSICPQGAILSVGRGGARTGKGVGAGFKPAR